GYNQAGLLAREVSRRTGLPMREDLLARRRDTPPQVQTATRKQRRTNVLDSFAAAEDAKGLAVVLLDDAFDIEGKVAEQAARAALFDPDGFGVRAAAVREYADDFLRIKGRIPCGRTRLRQPGDDRPYRVYFPSRRADCRRWCARALLASLHNALRFVAIGLAVVMSIQLYFLSASWVSP
ncbi:MAG: ComF family protein, partial [Gammaproteobacteria bacterium]